MQTRRQFIGTIAAASVASILADHAAASPSVVSEPSKSLCSQVKPARLAAKFKVRYPSGGSEWIDVGAPVLRYQGTDPILHFSLPMCTRAMTVTTAVLIDLDANKWLWKYEGEPVFMILGDQAAVDLKLDI